MTLPEPRSLVVGSTPGVVPGRQVFGVEVLVAMGTYAATAIIQTALERSLPFGSEVRIHGNQVSDPRVVVGPAYRVDSAVRGDGWSDVHSGTLRTAELSVRRRGRRRVARAAPGTRIARGKSLPRLQVLPGPGKRNLPPKACLRE